MFTHRIGYLAFAMAVIFLALALLWRVEWVLASLSSSAVAALFEKDYPSGL